MTVYGPVLNDGAEDREHGAERRGDEMRATII
jgi:hypothetical protein